MIQAQVAARRARRSFDPEIEGRQVAERTIGAIFGVAQRDGCFRREPEPGSSVYEQLKPLFDRCRLNEDGQDFTPLKPSPTVNASLTKLVRVACRHFGSHHLPTDGRTAPLQRTADQELLHASVLVHMTGRIGDDPELGRRARILKRIAAAAESELELHHADLINARIEAGWLAGGRPDRTVIPRRQEQMAAAAAAPPMLHGCQLRGLSMRARPLERARTRRLGLAGMLLRGFPYLRNYQLMTLAELAMLERQAAPRFIRERALMAGATQMGEPVGQLLDRSITRLNDALALPADPWAGSLAGRRIAFCGSGPLPLSAIFMHLMTDVEVVLIDRDQAAIERSSRLIANLERLEVLAPGKMKVVHRDAGSTVFQSRSTLHRAPPDAVVCDAVMVASLVPGPAKAEIVRRMGEHEDAPELLIMRSACGLSARLLYDAVELDGAIGERFAYCGEALPAIHVATHLGRAEALREGSSCTASRDLLAVAHPDVVNSTELHRKLPHGVRLRLPRADAGSSAMAAIAQLAQLRDTLVDAAGRAGRTATQQ